MSHGNYHEICLLFNEMMFFLKLLVLHRNHRQFLQTTPTDLFDHHLIVFADAIDCRASQALSCTT